MARGIFAEWFRRKGVAFVAMSMRSIVNSRLVASYMACGVASLMWHGQVLTAEVDGPLPGTQPLKLRGDISSQLIDGADTFCWTKSRRQMAMDLSEIVASHNWCSSARIGATR